MSIRDDLVEQQGEELLFMDDYDDCIIGICQQYGRPPVVAYDLDKVIEKLMDDGLTFEEAEEWWSFNQVGAWVGEYTPVFITEP